jgi:hypothetical protein
MYAKILYEVDSNEYNLLLLNVLVLMQGGQLQSLHALITGSTVHPCLCEGSSKSPNPMLEPE